MTAKEVICRALADGKSWEEIQALLKGSHRQSKAARDDKSCQEQVAWYRSQLATGRLVLLASGEVVNGEGTGSDATRLNDGVSVGSGARTEPARRDLTPANELLVDLIFEGVKGVARFVGEHAGSIFKSGARIKPERGNLAPASEILLGLFKGGEAELARFLLRHTYFISPDRIRKRIEATGSAAWFPEWVRGSNKHHPRKRKGDDSVWGVAEVKVRVYDNTKARSAFERFSGLVLAGNRPNRVRGYHVAHIWERVFDPEYFTAGWNLCLMPGFLKLFTEQQDRMALLHEVVQQAAFDLYFSGTLIGLPTPQFVTAPGLDLNAKFPGFKPNLL